MDYPFQVTVGVPVYNVEEYVEKAILSALEQDFTLPYEVLVVDDCGTDNSMDIVNHIATTHRFGDRIRIISHKYNRGIGQARNTVFDNAKGRYLFFMDPDDWMERNSISSLYYKAVELGSEITIGSSKYTNDDGIMADYKAMPDLVIKHPSSAGISLLVDHGIAMRGEMWGKLMSMDFIHKHSIRCINRIIEDGIPDFVSLVESHSICLVSDNVYYYYSKRKGSILENLQAQNVMERCTAWANIINTIQALVVNRYNNVPGIYDFYLSKTRSCYRHLLLDPLDEEQTQLINSRVKGSMSIVSSVWKIKKSRNRMMYLFLRHDDSLEAFSRYDRYLTGFVHLLSRIKEILRKS